MAKVTPATSTNVLIVSPDEVIYEGAVKRLFVPGRYGELAILPDHTPLYAQLLKGQIRYTPESGSEQQYPIEAGILRVKQNHVTIIVGFST